MQLDHQEFIQRVLRLSVVTAVLFDMKVKGHDLEIFRGQAFLCHDIQDAAVDSTWTHKRARLEKEEPADLEGYDGMNLRTEKVKKKRRQGGRQQASQT